MKQFLVFGMAVTLVWSCNSNHGSGYEEHFESDKELYSDETVSDGMIQSPVNILTANISEGNDRQIEIQCDAAGIKVETVTNTGHSVQVNFKHGNQIVFDYKHYEMIQAHFHTPYEHQIDGLTYPMEMHFVNELITESEQDTSAYLVIALLIKMGETNEFIDDFINNIPTEENTSTSILDAPTWKEEWLLDDVDQTLHYYYYKGSLTTPPFIETVNWLVSKKIFEASPEQIQYINDLEGDNARHVHALFNRKVENN